MTTSERPTPPAALERDGRDALTVLEDRDAETLRAVGDYLEELAEWKESTETDGEGAEGTESADNSENADSDGNDGFPDGVPERASVTVKEIAGTTYRYYQWRKGDRIESKTVTR